MADDARLSTALPAHPKTKKLIRRLGQASAWNLVCLILWAADSRSDGDLSGMSTEDIELAADWLGEDGAFVHALVEVRFLDGEEGAYKLHDWHEHNPWAAGAEKRSAKARWNAAKRHHGVAEADLLVPEYAAIRNASSTDAAQSEQATGNAPSPSPSDGGAASPRTPRASRRCPEGFEVTEDLEAWAAAEVPGVDVTRETAKFRDYTFKTANSDWPATWRNWMRKAFDMLPSKSNARASPVSFASQDREDGMRRWEEMTGRVHPDRQNPSVIDITPRPLSLEAM